MERTVPVTERALIQRINRKLQADGAKPGLGCRAVTKQF
jgi:hypothetical protein